MRFVKLSIISVIFLFLLISAFSLLIPSQVHISKAIQIKTKPDSLWKVVDDFGTWKNWNTLIPGLSSEKPDFNNSVMKTKNAEVKWETKLPDLRVARMQRENRKYILSGWRIRKEEPNDEIMLHWYINIKLRWYPWEKFGGMIYQKSYGDKLLQGLTALKTILEQNTRMSEQNYSDSL